MRAIVPSAGAGFTLIEVLIALLVFAFGISAVQSMSIATSRMLAVAERTGDHGSVATSRLEELRHGLVAETDSSALPPAPVGDAMILTVPSGSRVVVEDSTLPIAGSGNPPRQFRLMVKVYAAAPGALVSDTTRLVGLATRY